MISSLSRSLAVTLLAISAGLASAQTPAPTVPAASSKPSLQPSEDWNTLSIRSTHLQQPSATVIEHDVKPTYTRELIRVQWRAGDSMELFVFLPKGVSKPPAILYLYSYPADIDRFFDEGWARRATADGFAAIGFTSALTGQRYHNRPMKEWFVSELPEALGATVHDVQMILNYLSLRGEIDMGRIGMFGQGSGGTIALLAAQADPRIQAVDVLDPWGDWPDWLKESPQIPEEERATYLKPEFLHSVEKLDPVLYLPNLKMHSLRIQQILSDPVTPSKARDRIAAAAPSPEVVSRFNDATAHFDAMHRVGPSGLLKEQLSSMPVSMNAQSKSAQSDSKSSPQQP